MGDSIVMRPDDVREDRWDNRLVRLLGVRDGEDGESGSEVDIQVVEDVLTGRRYKTPVRNLGGHCFSEMEVLAFIAEQSTACACCGRDGGRTWESEGRPYCGGCYRASCDTHKLPCRGQKKEKSIASG